MESLSAVTSIKSLKAIPDQYGLPQWDREYLFTIQKPKNWYKTRYIVHLFGICLRFLTVIYLQLPGRMD